MSRQYSSDPYQSSQRPAPVQSYRSPDGAPRRNTPAPSRDVSFQSTFQPHRERNRPPPAQEHYYGEYYSRPDRYSGATRPPPTQVNNPSNDRPRRRYRLESPSHHSRVPYSQSHESELPRSSDRHRYKQRQPAPASNQPPASQSHRYDEGYSDYGRNADRYHRAQRRDETYPVQAYHPQPNHRSLAIPSVSPRPRSIRRSSDRSFSPPAQSPLPVQLHDPISLLAHLLDSVLGGRDSPASTASDEDSSMTAMDFIAFTMMMHRPSIVHIQLSDLFNLLGDDEPPSVGLSDHDIRRIPTMTYKKSSRSKSTDDKCAVCLSSYKTGESVKRLRCEHFFHAECIDPWLKTSVQCPICRGAQTN